MRRPTLISLAGGKRIGRLGTLAAVLGCLLLGLGFPLLDGALTFRSMRATLEMEVRVAASMANRVIQTYPELWRFADHPFMDIIEQRPVDDIGLSFARIVDNTGTVVAESHTRPAGPFLTRSYPIFDSGNQVGQVEIGRTLRPFLNRVSFRLTVGAALAMILFLLLRRTLLIPFTRSMEAITGERTWYRHLFDGANDMVFVNELLPEPRPGPIREANATACVRLGYSPQEIVQVDPLAVFSPQVAEGRREELFGRLRLQGWAVYEAVLSTKGGARIPVEVNTQVVSREGKPMLYSVARDIGERKAAEAQIRTSLQEKEILLREIHHRVKNNLQVISHLLFLQFQHFRDPDVRDLFRESQARIRTMALVHESLYRSDDLSLVDVSQYLQSLTSQIMQSYSLHHSNVGLVVKADPFRMAADTVIPCALIVNELLGNALKHGFPEARAGRVWVTFRALPEGLFTLQVKDDGVGFPEGVDFRQSRTLGMSLVTQLAAQLGADLTLDREGGTTWTLTFREYREAETLIY